MFYPPLSTERKIIMQFRVLLFSFFIFLSNYPALADIKSAPVIDNLQAVVPLDKAIRKGVLPNGLIYYIKKNTKPEQRMELRLVVKAGAINEDADQNGLAHFVEHMLFNGTTHFPKNQLIHDLEKIGVRFGADLNAYTTEDHTVYELPIPTDKPELIDLGFKIVADWAGRATFEGKEIERERGIVLEEWRSNQGAEAREEKAHRSINYYGSKLIQHDVIGQAAVIQKAPHEAVKRFYQDWYRPNLMAIIAVGDFDVNAIEAQIKTQFSYLKNPPNPRQLSGDDIEIKPNKAPLISIYSDKEQTATTLLLAYNKPAENQATLGYLKHSFMHTILAAMMQERIERLLQQQNPTMQIAGINYGVFFRQTARAGLYVIPKTDDLMQGYQDFLSTFFQAEKNGFSAAEYERAKKNLLSALEASYQNRDKTNSVDFANEYIRNFIHNEFVSGIEYEYKQSKKLAQTVSLAEINALLKTYISDDNRLLMLSAVNKKGIILPTKEQLLTTYTTLKNRSYPAFKDDFSNQALFTKKLTPGSIVKTQEIKELGITELVLSNGIKVALKPSHFNEREILFWAISKGGSSLVSEENYLNANYAGDIISSSGIAEFSLPTLTKLLAGKQVTLSPYVTTLHEGLNGQATPKDIETLLQLIHLYFAQPRKDSEAFNAFVSHQKQWIDDFKRHPEMVFNETITYIMSGNDPRSKPLTKESLAGLNLDKAYQIYQQRFADPSDFNFVFTGNIEIEKFKGLLNQYIASLPTKGNQENFQDVFHQSPKQAITKNFYSGKENKAHVNLILNGAADYNRKEIYTAQALVDILNYRLNDKIREEKSAVYSINGAILFNHYPKSEYKLSIDFGCEPNKVNAIVAQVKAILQDLQINLPTDEEMLKVKSADTRQYEVNLKENSYWQSKMVNAYYHGLPIQEIIEQPVLIKNLSKADIKAAANHYFALSSLKQFVLYPEKKSKK